MDCRGYSSRIVEANAIAAGKSDSPGILLGKYMISRDIPVAEVTDYFGVSRMTIYKWMVGTSTPRKRYIEKIEHLLHIGGV